MSAFRLRNPAGKPLGVATLAIDVTADTQRRAVAQVEQLGRAAGVDQAHVSGVGDV
ncbi:hypothetical protein [Streptomyces gibsoniae]|uniref:Uncharacterized protein n=1 Tax=Streptomyces gibsoniae TaxID=3075529 RepID=A0ABU2U2H5_9ACTN|nr:hypothetical protein [Streptomyces sp. DSM 41699]MDT0467418.1 hypothetical protein [Streptomyces sp. DSM 41699]